jgi:hypothetical protein
MPSKPAIMPGMWLRAGIAGTLRRSCHRSRVRARS